MTRLWRNNTWSKCLFSCLILRFWALPLPPIIIIFNFIHTNLIFSAWQGVLRHNSLAIIYSKYCTFPMLIFVDYFSSYCTFRFFFIEKRFISCLIDVSCTLFIKAKKMLHGLLLLDKPQSGPPSLFDYLIESKPWEIVCR